MIPVSSRRMWRNRLILIGAGAVVASVGTTCIRAARSEPERPRGVVGAPVVRADAPLAQGDEKDNTHGLLPPGPRQPPSELLTITLGGRPCLVWGQILGPVQLGGDPNIRLLLIPALVMPDEEIHILLYEGWPPSDSWCTPRYVGSIVPDVPFGGMSVVDVDGDGAKEVVIAAARSSRSLRIYRLRRAGTQWTSACIFREEHNGDELLRWDTHGRQGKGEWVIEEYFGPPGRQCLTLEHLPSICQRFGDGMEHPFYVEYRWSSEKGRFVVTGADDSHDIDPDLWGEWPNP